jgi:hypothetical protein
VTRRWIGKLLDIQIWIERNVANWSWRRLVSGLLIVCAAVFSMGLLLPPIASDFASVPVTKGLTQIWPLLLDRRDSRAFRLRPAASANEDTFDLLWISDSAMLVKDAPPEHRYRNMPQYSAIHPLAEYIKTIGGKKLVIHDYFITGMRSGDLRRVILHGISDPEIDAAIININPMMVFNDLMPFGISNQRMALYREPGLTAHRGRACSCLKRLPRFGRCTPRAFL